MEAARRPAWRVCVTRDEGARGPLGQALEAQGFVAVSCPVMVERPPERPDLLRDAARRLDTFDWIICASARAVRALAEARIAPWPSGVRTAGVGPATARALEAAGAAPPPLVGDGDGADALWTALRETDVWPGRRVLLPTTPGGRRTLADGLRAAGANVEEVEAYRMCPREPGMLRADWTHAAADAVVLASPRAAAVLAAAVGADALRRLRGVVAIGGSTAEALARLGVTAIVPPRADFGAAAGALVALRNEGCR